MNDSICDEKEVFTKIKQEFIPLLDFLRRGDSREAEESAKNLLITKKTW